MKKLKQLDLLIQGLLMIVAVVLVIINDNWMPVSVTPLALWQVTSMVYHQATGTYTGRLMPRYYFHRFALLAGFGILLSFVLSFYLLITSILYPVLPAIFLSYGFICYRETFRYMIRPLELV